MSRWNAVSDLDYYGEDVEMQRREPEPIAKVCCYCEPHHEISEGTYPASHGMCEKAAAIQHALIDAEDAAKRQQGAV